MAYHATEVAEMQAEAHGAATEAEVEEVEAAAAHEPDEYDLVIERAYRTPPRTPGGGAAQAALSQQQLQLQEQQRSPNPLLAACMCTSSYT